MHLGWLRECPSRTTLLFTSIEIGCLIVFLALVAAPAVAVRQCDDGLRCTVDDQCIEASCDGTFRTCEDDGDACTRDSCNPATGGCVHTPISCDGPCLTGACDPGLGCIRIPDGTPCDDAKLCSTDDSCLLGICRGTPVADGTPCSDLFGPCTTDDVCVRGSCRGRFVLCPNSDGDLCTSEFCDFSTGACLTLPRRRCDQPCETGACDAATGRCPVLPDGSPCDDGNQCTGSDHCFGGECDGAALLFDDTPTPTPRATDSPTAPSTATPTARPATPTLTMTSLPTPTTPTPAGGSNGGCAIDRRHDDYPNPFLLLLVAPLALTLRSRRNRC